jgi:hypothetical protein
MRRRYWIAAGVAVVAIVAAGSALAATKFESPSARSQAIISDAAGRLHVTPGALSSALKKALADQVDAAVAAGRLTKAQGDALKARIAAGPVPLGGFGLGFGPIRPGFGRPGFAGPLPGFFRHERPGIIAPGMFGAGLHAVTSYLGITGAQLHAELAAGKSLAQIAKAHGKTTDGLIAALVATAKSRLDRAVAGKHLSATQEKAILARLHGFFEEFVNHTLPGPLRLLPFRPGFGSGWGHRPLRPYFFR